MSKQQERKEQIKELIIQEAEYLAECIVKNRDIFLKSSANGLAIYSNELKRLK